MVSPAYENFESHDKRSIKNTHIFLFFSLNCLPCTAYEICESHMIEEVETKPLYFFFLLNCLPCICGNTKF